jgi:hypothetical protein
VSTINTAGAGAATIVSPVVISYSPDATFGMTADAQEVVTVSGIMEKFVVDLSTGEALAFLNAIDVSGLTFDNTLGEVREELENCDVSFKEGVRAVIARAITDASNGTVDMEGWLKEQLRYAFIEAFPTYLDADRVGAGAELTGGHSGGAGTPLTSVQANALIAAWSAYKAAKAAYEAIDLPGLKAASDAAAAVEAKLVVALADAVASKAAKQAIKAAAEAAAAIAASAKDAADAAATAATAVYAANPSQANLALKTAADEAAAAALAAKDLKDAAVTTAQGHFNAAETNRAAVAAALGAASTGATTALNAFETALEANASTADVALYGATDAAGTGLAMEGALTAYLNTAPAGTNQGYTVEKIQAYQDISGFTGVIDATSNVNYAQGSAGVVPGLTAAEGVAAMATATTIVYETVINAFSVDVDISGGAAATSFWVQQNAAKSVLRRSLYRQIPKVTWTKYYSSATNALDTRGLPLAQGDSMIFVFDLDLKATPGKSAPTASAPNVISLDLGVRRVSLELKFPIVAGAATGDKYALAAVPA